MKTRYRRTRRWAGWSLLAGLALVCLPVGLNAADPDAAGKSKIGDRGQASPKALVETMAGALSLRSPSLSWIGFHTPANRALLEPQADLAAQLGAKANEAADLVQARIGKMEAGMVRTLNSGVHSGAELALRYQLSQIAPNGTVDWDKAKLVEEGDKARVTITATGEAIPLAKVEGKWYLSGNPEALAKETAAIKETTAKTMNLLDQLEQKVQSGQITRKNFIQEYQKLINENMAG